MEWPRGAVRFWASPPPSPPHSWLCSGVIMGKPEKEDLVLRELRCTHRGSRDKASGPGSQLSHLEPSGQFPHLSLGMSSHLFPPHDWSEAHTCVRAHVCVDTAHSTTVECHLFTDMLFLPFQHFWTLLTGRVKGGGCGFNQESWTVFQVKASENPNARLMELAENGPSCLLGDCDGPPVSREITLCTARPSCVPASSTCWTGWTNSLGTTKDSHLCGKICKKREGKCADFLQPLS